MKRFQALLIFLAPLALFAQNTALGVMLGGSNYQGDLAKTHVVIGETNAAGGLFVRRQVLPKLTVKGNFYIGKITGNDANFPDRFRDRAYSFKSWLLEGGLNVEWDLLGRTRNFRKGQYMRTFTPYLLTGFGAVYYNPKVTMRKICEDDAENISRTFNFIIPMGAGLKYDLTPRHTLGIEFVTHLPFTDYLDGISYCGEPGNHDWYVFGGITFQYWFSAPDVKFNDDL